jgi:hypothetical protein
MTRRTIIIVIIVILGLVFLIPPNPYTDPITRPVIKVIRKVVSYFNEDLDIPVPVSETKVYKWQDESGEWHFSNTPPPKGVDSRSKTYKSDENVLPAPKADD